MWQFEDLRFLLLLRLFNNNRMINRRCYNVLIIFFTIMIYKNILGDDYEHSGCMQIGRCWHHRQQHGWRQRPHLPLLPPRPPPRLLTRKKPRPVPRCAPCEQGLLLMLLEKRELRFAISGSHLWCNLRIFDLQILFFGGLKLLQIPRYLMFLLINKGLQCFNEN